MPPDDTAVIDPPKTEVKQPSLGDKFRAEFSKIEGVEPPPTAAPVKEPDKTPPPAEPEKKAEPEQKEAAPVSKPSSPLDALLGKEKSAEKVETPDVLKEFDDQKPNWTRAREVMKTQSGRIKELDSEIAKLKTAPKIDTTELDALKTERQQLQERIAQQETNLKAINAEYSEDFQSLLKEREGVLRKIETRAKSYGADPEMLLSVLDLREGKLKTQYIKEALSELDPDDKARIHTLIESLEGTNDKISDFRKDLPGKFDELQTRREAQQRAESEKNLKALTVEFGKIVDELPKDVVTLREVADDVEGAEEWNAGIRGAKERALNALKPGGSDFRHTGEIAWKGEHYDDLAKYTMNLHAENAEFRAHQKESDVSAPDFKGGTKPKTEPDLKPADKYRKALAAQQAAED